MIIVLTGAKKNVGDYLISSRAKKLLREFVDTEIVELDRFECQEKNLDLINRSRSVILAGGPAYAENIYPGIYPIVRDLDSIKVPIIPFGLGWSGRPMFNPDRFMFTKNSVKFLDKIHSSIEFSSCRDKITHSLLKRFGYTNVKMTGCPVWYDLDSIGNPLNLVGFNKIIFTTPAKSILVRQNYLLMKELRKQFPHSEIVCSFHRGILPDKHTNIRHSTAYSAMALSAKILGFKVIDSSYDLGKISFYKDFDFHVGYRVHAHLDFLSRRKPSILVNEDGRGLGMVRSLRLPELNYNDPKLIKKYQAVLTRYKEFDLSELMNAVNVIDSTFGEMRSFLSSI